MADIIKAKQDKIKSISNTLKSIDIDKLTTEQLNQIEKLLIIDEAKEKVKKEIKKYNINLDDKIKLFLKGFEGNTFKMYKKILEYFKRYLLEKKLHLLEFAEPINIDNFISELNENVNTKRLYISCLSSFFSKLERWKTIERNYFKGAKLPKKQRTRELKIMSNDDYNKIIESLQNELNNYKKVRGSYKRQKEIINKWIIIFKLLYETGLRISAIKTIKIGQNGLLNYYSKGKEGSINILKELASELRTIALNNISEQSIQKALQKQCKKAGLNIIYNPHSIRHLFAINYYEKTKDIYGLQKLLNHSSISITEAYLRGLKIL